MRIDRENKLTDEEWQQIREARAKMYKVHDTIWVIGQADLKGKFRGMHKVLCHCRGEVADGGMFFKSAAEAFDRLEKLDDDVRKSFRVFEVPITTVCELSAVEDEGKSYRFPQAGMKSGVVADCGN